MKFTPASALLALAITISMVAARPLPGQVPDRIRASPNTGLEAEVQMGKRYGSSVEGSPPESPRESSSEYFTPEESDHEENYEINDEAVRAAQWQAEHQGHFRTLSEIARARAAGQYHQDDSNESAPETSGATSDASSSKDSDAKTESYEGSDDEEEQEASDWEVPEGDNDQDDHEEEEEEEEEDEYADAEENDDDD